MQNRKYFPILPLNRRKRQGRGGAGNLCRKIFFNRRAKRTSVNIGMQEKRWAEKTLLEGAFANRTTSEPQ